MKTKRSLTLIGILAATGLSTAFVAQTSVADPLPGHSPTLVRVVRASTQRFLNISHANAEGYGRLLGCTSGDEQGAMGLHYANPGLVGDGALDATRPEVLMYEPKADGRMQLIGVEYVVIAEAWDAGHAAPPVLMGQLLHYEGSPNRYGLPAFYALHVWAWKPNPKGVFADWNPTVTCEYYTG